MHYDLLIYHDISDDTESTGQSIPNRGDQAEKWFGDLGKDRVVVAIGPGLHHNKTTVVLAHSAHPMDELQRMVDRARE